MAMLVPPTLNFIDNYRKKNNISFDFFPVASQYYEFSESKFISIWYKITRPTNSMYNNSIKYVLYNINNLIDNFRMNNAGKTYTLTRIAKNENTSERGYNMHLLNTNDNSEITVYGLCEKDLQTFTEYLLSENFLQQQNCDTETFTETLTMDKSTNTEICVSEIGTSTETLTEDKSTNTENYVSEIGTSTEMISEEDEEYLFL